MAQILRSLPPRQAARLSSGLLTSAWLSLGRGRHWGVNQRVKNSLVSVSLPFKYNESKYTFCLCTSGFQRFIFF